MNCKTRMKESHKDLAKPILIKDLFQLKMKSQKYKKNLLKKMILFSN